MGHKGLGHHVSWSSLLPEYGVQHICRDKQYKFFSIDCYPFDPWRGNTKSGYYKHTRSPLLADRQGTSAQQSTNTYPP